MGDEKATEGIWKKDDWWSLKFYYYQFKCLM